MEIIAYHGGDSPIRRFARSRSAQGVFWFSEDKDRILAGESGASSVKYLMEARLTVDKVAGRDEYDRYGLGELRGLGYDSVRLEDSWIVFDTKRIKVIRAVRVVNATDLMTRGVP